MYYFEFLQAKCESTCFSTAVPMECLFCQSSFLFVSIWSCLIVWFWFFFSHKKDLIFFIFLKLFAFLSVNYRFMYSIHYSIGFSLFLLNFWQFFIRVMDICNINWIHFLLTYGSFWQEFLFNKVYHFSFCIWILNHSWKHETLQSLYIHLFSSSSFNLHFLTFRSLIHLGFDI